MRLTESRWGRRVLFSALYFSEGAPIGYVWWALPTRLRAAGMPVDEVTALTSLLVLPWAFKFLWAPLVDATAGSRFGLRGWILVSQILMGLTLLMLLALDPVAAGGLVVLVLLSHATCAATQDVAIDAMVVRVIPENERGRMTAWMQAGMLVARGVFGGVSLWAERYIGAAGVILLLVACIWGSGALVLLAGRPSAVARASTGAAWRAVLNGVVRALTARQTWIGFGIALTAGAGFEAVGALAGPLLIDAGRNQEAVGIFFALPVIACMVGGSVIGGIVADRVGRRAAVAGAVLLTGAAVVVAGVVLMAEIEGPLNASGPWDFVAVGLVYCTLGVLTASSYALFMDLTDPSIGGTQFSAYMGATNLCESWSARAAGALVVSIGTAQGFAVLAAVSLISLPLLAVARGYRSAQGSGGRA